MNRHVENSNVENFHTENSKTKTSRALQAGSTLLALCALLALAFGVRVMPNASAQDRVSPPIIIGPPIIMPPPRPFPPVLNQELQLVSQNAKVEISGALAKTHLTQIFRNATNRRIEGTYIFPLPAGASVSGFAMTVNGKRLEAEFLEGDKAREIYQNIVAKLRDPALLEFVDRDLIRAKIFPIEPGATQQMELEYSQPLRADNGSFRYVIPMRLAVGGAAERASVDIKISSPDGVQAVYSPTHPIEVTREGDSARVTGEFDSEAPRRPQAGSTPDAGAARDFVLYYTTSRAKVGVSLVTHREAGEDGTFMLLLAPDSQIAPAEIAAKDVVFVFDTSGSMSGEKIEQARQALLNLLGNLNPDDRFNIVTFSSATRSFRDGLTTASPDVLKAAREWAKNIKAVGGTNINDALLESIKMLRDTSARPQQIVFMTDGQPTVGETDVEQILKNVRAAGENEYLKKRVSSERIFVFGVGYDVNTRLLDALAEENRGASDYVLPEENIEEKVGALYNKIAFPVLSNPRLDWHGARVYDVFPQVLPDLFKGAQTIVFGRFALGNEGGSTPSAAPTLIGNIGGREETFSGRGDFSQTDSSDVNDALPRLWATRKIGFLMDEARRANRTIDPEVKNEIMALGKKYGIVTPFTAGLITEDNRPLDLTTPIFSSNGNFGAAGQIAADAARGMNAPSSGEQAVKAARATQKYRNAQTLPTPVSPSATRREIAGKTFELKSGVWTDSAYDSQKMTKLETIKFASPEYFALAKDARVAKWLSVGEKVIVVLDGRVIRIVD